MKIIEEKNIPLVEAREILEEKEKTTKAAEKELGYEQKITLEYLRKFSLLIKKEAEAAWKELAAIGDGVLRDHQIAQLLDVMPENEEEVKILLMKERLDLSVEQIKAILEALAKVRPSKEAKKIKAARVEKKEAPKAPESAPVPEAKVEKAEEPTKSEASEASKSESEAQGFSAGLKSRAEGEGDSNAKQ